MEIRLRTLTPIWTGGIEGRADRLHETGIIGSLRWWYEAVVRGLGGDACDPTEHRCEFKPERAEDKEAIQQGKTEPDLLRAANLCDACQVFGATSWRRRFRLTVEDMTGEYGPVGQKTTTGSRFKRDGRERPQWYFNAPARSGAFVVRVLPLASDFDPILLTGLLKLVEKQAGLGARTQLGYGWIEEDHAGTGETVPFDVEAYITRQRAAIGSPIQPDRRHPALDNMFFTHIRPGDAGLTATLNLKYDVRAMFRKAFKGDQQLRHFVCGSVQGNQREASKVFYTQAVDGVMRVWGWIPEELPVEGVTRDEVVAAIKQSVDAFGSIIHWREFNSSRDTVTPSLGDRTLFLTSLLHATEVRYDSA